MSGAIIALVCLLFCLGTVFYNFEKKVVTAQEIALLATMTTLAALFRLPFAFFPNLQPTTFLVMITGYVWGSQKGFLVGALAALVSNFFLGQGPWTPWQMLAWGLCGALAGILGRKAVDYNSKKFAWLAFFCGYLFGWLINFWHWLAFIYPLNLKTWLVVCLASFPFDTIHALGNLMFSIILGPLFYPILKRFRQKFKIEFL
ncbi:MAG TPA: ECF transporter S component [Clostridia bacterium]|jgi:energy-coupling factor transport system substrate-specific component|nr:ECF transporter S component [Clostridia bacterium]